MKFAKSDQRYLSQRKEFSQQLGDMELWSVIDHWPLYAGIGNVGRFLGIADVLKSTLTVPGHIAEFGCWQGANTVWMAKLLKLLDPYGPKVVHAFDSFQGLTAFRPQDGHATEQRGRYAGSLERLKGILELYELTDDVNIHVGLIEDTLPPLVEQRQELTFSLLYCDTDLYESTRVILEHAAPRLAKGGVILFDEWNHETYPGEGVAANEFIADHRSEYDVLTIPFARQPSMMLRKL